MQLIVSPGSVNESASLEEAAPEKDIYYIVLPPSEILSTNKDCLNRQG